VLQTNDEEVDDDNDAAVDEQDGDGERKNSSCSVELCAAVDAAPAPVQ